MAEIMTYLQGGLHNIVAFIVVLSIVVFVHEFGHYWVARRCGVKIDSFSIGFGHEIFGWFDKSGTRWKVCWLPFGGYVKMFGDADASSSTASDETKQMSAEEKALTFTHKTVGQRFAIVAAGPAFNYLFAIVVLMVLFVSQGQAVTPPVVDTVLPDSAAQEAGLQQGDHIISISDEVVDRFEDIKRLVALSDGSALQVKLIREGKEMTLSLTPRLVEMTDRFGNEQTMPQMGISSQQVVYEKHGVLSGLKAAIVETVTLTTSTLEAVGQMIRGTRSTEELGGPLRIAEMSGKVAHEGLAAFLWFMAILSINLGLINLFPIPMLDGGNLMYYLAEMLLRRPLSEQAQEIGARIGFVFVVGLMVFATWNDLVYRYNVVSYIQGIFS